MPIETNGVQRNGLRCLGRIRAVQGEASRRPHALKSQYGFVRSS